jgi:hypothetical protein
MEKGKILACHDEWSDEGEADIMNDPFGSLI